MKKMILICFLAFSWGCELHEQKNSGEIEREQKVVNLSVIEELTSAILRNDLDQLNLTLDDGNFDVNIPNKSGELLLNKAVESERFVITLRLLESGADPDLRDSEDLSAREVASNSNYKDDWELLFSSFKITQETGVSEAFKVIEQTSPSNEKGIQSVLEGLFTLGTPLDGQNSGQFTYLMVAASRGLIQTVELLCSYQETDPNIVVTRGRGRRQRTFTALSLSNSEDVKQALYRCGAVDQI